MSERAIIDPFELFASRPFYQVLNQNLVDSLGLCQGNRVLDVACGPGNISKPIAEKIGPDGEIFAIDFSRKALEAARRNLEGVATRFNLIQSKAEDISNIFGNNVQGTFDAAVIGNAIHNFADKVGFVKAVRRLLKWDSPFAFSTTFYEGAVPEEEKRFYNTWIFNAMKMAAGLSGRGEKRERVSAREAAKWLGPDDYKKMLTEEGFAEEDIFCEFKTANMTSEDFEAISQDDEFASGALPRFPLAVAKEALATAVRGVFEERKMESSPRNWFQVVAFNRLII